MKNSFFIENFRMHVLYRQYLIYSSNLWIIPECDFMGFFFSGQYTYLAEFNVPKNDLERFKGGPSFKAFKRIPFVWVRTATTVSNEKPKDDTCQAGPFYGQIGHSYNQNLRSSQRHYHSDEHPHLCYFDHYSIGQIMVIWSVRW